MKILSNNAKMKRGIRQRLFSAYDFFLIKLDFFRSTSTSRLSLFFQGAIVGRRLKTSGQCLFKCRHHGALRIGHCVTLLAGHRSNRVGLSNPVLVETLGHGVIQIGNNSGGSAVVISSRESITIGENVKIGGNVRIFDHDFHALNADIRRTVDDSQQVRSKPVIIEDDVFIGTNAIILKGVRIGARSVVGAGSVVTIRDIPPDSVVAGNPARILSKGS